MWISCYYRFSVLFSQSNTHIYPLAHGQPELGGLKRRISFYAIQTVNGLSEWQFSVPETLNLEEILGLDPPTTTPAHPPKGHPRPTSMTLHSHPSPVQSVRMCQEWFSHLRFLWRLPRLGSMGIIVLPTYMSRQVTRLLASDNMWFLSNMKLQMAYNNKLIAIHTVLVWPKPKKPTDRNVETAILLIWSRI